MQIKSSIVLLAMSFAGSALADARFSTNSHPPTISIALMYAQAQIGDLSQSDMRRLVFYADRATRTLQNLVEGAVGRSIADQDKVNKRFRESISRMAEAGAKTGLSTDQIADFYRQNVADTFGQEFMDKLDTFAGGLEFRTLFRNVATVSTPVGSVSENELMDALAVASQDLQLETPFSESAQVVATAPTAIADAPQALPNANPLEVDIVKRVQVVDGRWELTIQSGDSLSSIASAIYGDALSYTTIQSANSAVINNPNLIEVGTRLVLPKP